MKTLSPPLIALFVGIAALLVYAGWQVEARRSGLGGERRGPAVDTSHTRPAPADAEPARTDGAGYAPYAIDPAAANGCAGDDDCVRVDADCCGLAGAGRCATVPRRKVVEVTRARVAACREVVCPSLVSQHPTCSAAFTCIQGQCALASLPDAAPFGLGVKPIR